MANLRNIRIYEKGNVVEVSNDNRKDEQWVAEYAVEGFSVIWININSRFSFEATRRAIRDYKPKLQGDREIEDVVSMLERMIRKEERMVTANPYNPY